jgi:uncharacterized iron-regulated protein
MKLNLFLLFVLVPSLAVCQADLTAHYKIYNTKDQKQVTLNDVVTQLKNADVLFFGEEHNDSTGHVLEFRLLEQISNKFPGRVALSMEMFETDCQDVLNEYLQGLIREKNFIEDARAWPNYKDYRPMIEFARVNNITVIAANAPSRYTNMVNRLGMSSLQRLSATGKSYLPPLPVDTATGPYYEKFVNIMGGHTSMAGMQMYQAQNLWDATMGWSIAKFFKEHHDFKILQINGGFHSEEKLGAVAQLKKYAPGIQIINIAAYADENFEHPDWSVYKNFGDYIIITDPKIPKTF